MNFTTIKTIKIIFGILFAIAFTIGVVLVYATFLNPGQNSVELVKDFLI